MQVNIVLNWYLSLICLWYFIKKANASIRIFFDNIGTKNKWGEAAFKMCNETTYCCELHAITLVVKVATVWKEFDKTQI